MGSAAFSLQAFAFQSSASTEYWLKVAYGSSDTQLHARVLERDGRWYIRQMDLAALGLSEPDALWFRDDGELFFPLADLRALAWKVDVFWKLLHLAPLPAPDNQPPMESLDESWLEISVNGGTARVGFALVADDGQVYVDSDVLEGFRLNLSALDALQVYQRSFHVVSSIPASWAVLDRRRQRLELYAPAEAFRRGEIHSSYSRLVSPDITSRGGFLNYGLFSSHTPQDDRFDGQFEAGFFAGRALLTSSQLARDISGDEQRAVRLESTLRLDWPESMRTLRLGDSVGFAGSWGLPARFGGIQWGTNFGTQPGFITFPMPDITVDAAVPSTVDIFINNALRASEQIAPGPFTMREVPVVTGSGEIRLVVRDLFGREQVITESFYATPQLLRRGLHEYSYEAGSLRRNFGLDGSDYEQGFIAGTHRYGFNDRLTGELRGELLREVATAGAAANWLWPQLGEFQLSLAASNNRDSGRRGEQASLGFRRQGPRWGLGASARISSADFMQLGALDIAPNRLRANAFGSVGFGRAGAATVGYVQQKARDGEDIEFATFQYSVSFFGALNLQFNAFEPLSGNLQRSAQLSLSLPLGARTSVQLSANHQQSGEGGGRLQLQRNLQAGSGIGYRVLAEDGPLKRIEAGLQLRGSAATLTADAARVNGSEQIRSSLSGGVAMMAGRFYLSRELDQSFAVVEAPGLAGIDIYHDNQRVARTGADGRAIVPGLRAFQENRVRLDNTALPMDREIQSLEESVIPAFRQGVALQFAVRRSHWVGLHLYTEDNKPLPAGSALRDLVSGVVFPVGFDGRVYLDVSPGRYRYRANWGEQSCEVALTVPESVESLEELGPRTCGRICDKEMQTCQ